MNAIEELSELRKQHIALQQKYKDECLKARELRTQLECSKETEEILIKFETTSNSSQFSFVQTTSRFYEWW